MHSATRVIDDAMYLVRTFRPDIDRVLDSVPILSGPLPSTCGALYRGDTRHITINQHNELESDSLASLLVHEGTHALDHAQGRLRFPKQSFQDHVEPELRAFHAQAEFWQKLYSYGKVPERNGTDRMSNEILSEFKDGTLDQHVTRMYGSQWDEAMEHMRHGPRYPGYGRPGYGRPGYSRRPAWV